MKKLHTLIFLSAVMILSAVTFSASAAGLPAQGSATAVQPDAGGAESP